MPARKFLEKCIIRPAGECKDRNAAALTGDYIRLGGLAEGCAIVISFGDGSAAHDVIPALYQAKDAAGTDAKVLNCLETGRIYTMQAADYATLAAETGFTKETQATADEQFTDADSGEQAGITVFEVFAEDLDGANGFTHIRCDIADPTAAKVIDVLYILHGLNYAAAPESQIDPLV